MRINEDTKVTLTVQQIRRLVKEAKQHKKLTKETAQKPARKRVYVKSAKVYWAKEGQPLGSISLDILRYKDSIYQNAKEALLSVCTDLLYGDFGEDPASVSDPRDLMSKWEYSDEEKGFTLVAYRGKRGEIFLDADSDKEMRRIVVVARLEANLDVTDINF